MVKPRRPSRSGEHPVVTWAGVVKVQMPLNDDSAPALVSSRDGSIAAQVPITEDLTEVMGARAKVYFTATLQQGMVHLLGEAKGQSW